MGTARVHTASRDTGGLRRCEVGTPRNGSLGGRPPQTSEGLIVPTKSGNADGGKEPWFGVRPDEPRRGGLA